MVQRAACSTPRMAKTRVGSGKRRRTSNFRNYGLRVETSRKASYMYVFLLFIPASKPHVHDQHHDSMTRIHITLNTKKIQSRKGVGNKPFLFLSFGSVDLFAPPSATSSIILTGITPVRWNGLFAFDKFLQAEAERERLEYGDVTEELPDADAGELDPDLVSSLSPWHIIILKQLP
jgi:hypothetical protein